MRPSVGCCCRFCVVRGFEEPGEGTTQALRAEMSGVCSRGIWCVGMLFGLVIVSLLMSVRWSHSIARWCEVV